jgi:hypothetical protein
MEQSFNPLFRYKKNAAKSNTFQFPCVRDHQFEYEEKTVNEKIVGFFKNPKPTKEALGTGTGAAAGATALGVFAPVAAVAGIQGIGFTTGGIAAGSTAAGMMSAAGPVAAGSTVATLQSIGALGALGAGASAGVGLLGAVLGAGFITATVYGGFKIHESLKYHDEEVPCWDRCHHRHVAPPPESADQDPSEVVFDTSYVDAM